MKEYGYCRISTPRQSIDRQIRNITAAYPDAHIVTETYTGTTLQRPAFEKLLKEIRKNPDARLIFDSVSRMSRSAEEGFELYKELFDLGTELVFLKEPQLNTKTYKQAIASSMPEFPETGNAATDEFILGITAAVNKYILRLAEEQIRLAFIMSQKEVDDLRQRTKEGIETARLAGKQIGQVKGKRLTTKKSIEAKKMISQHSKTFGGSLSDEECIRLCGISRNTFYSYKKELRLSGTGILDNEK